MNKRNLIGPYILPDIFNGLSGAWKGEYKGLQLGAHEELTRPGMKLIADLTQDPLTRISYYVDPVANLLKGVAIPLPNIYEPNTNLGKVIFRTGEEAVRTDGSIIVPTEVFTVAENTKDFPYSIPLEAHNPIIANATMLNILMHNTGRFISRNW